MSTTPALSLPSPPPVCSSRSAACCGVLVRWLVGTVESDISAVRSFEFHRIDPQIPSFLAAGSFGTCAYYAAWRFDSQRVVGTPMSTPRPVRAASVSTTTVQSSHDLAPAHRLTNCTWQSRRRGTDAELGTVDVAARYRTRCGPDRSARPEATKSANSTDRWSGVRIAWADVAMRSRSMRSRECIGRERNRDVIGDSRARTHVWSLWCASDVARTSPRHPPTALCYHSLALSRHQTEFGEICHHTHTVDRHRLCSQPRNMAQPMLPECPSASKGASRIELVMCDMAGQTSARSMIGSRCVEQLLTGAQSRTCYGVVCQVRPWMIRSTVCHS
jgi:hypothetical protein